MQHWLICYDIEDNKERNRIYKCLLTYGKPVQKSVFEVTFPDRKWKMQQAMIEQLRQIASENANIRFYHLGKESLKKSWTLNNDPICYRPGAIIV